MAEPAAGGTFIFRKWRTVFPALRAEKPYTKLIKHHLAWAKKRASESSNGKIVCGARSPPHQKKGEKSYANAKG
ncbi:MAG: hypothetical protein U0Z44_17870 [Kouleothrix sp.]